MGAQKSNETRGDYEGESQDPHRTQHASFFENSHVLLFTLHVDRLLLRLSEHGIILPFILHNVRTGGNDSREWRGLELNRPSRLLLRVTSTFKFTLTLLKNRFGSNNALRVQLMLILMQVLQ